MGINISKSRKKRRAYYSPPPPAFLPYTLSDEGVIIPKLDNNNFNDTLELPHRYVNNTLTHTSSVDNVNYVNTSCLIFDYEDMSISGSDCFSKATMDIISVIFSYLTIDDICTVQRVSRFWYKTLEANDMWKVVVRRESKNWTAKAHDYVMKCSYAELTGENVVRWKDLLRDYYRKRNCCKCSGRYRMCYNTAVACVRHSGIRDLVEDRGIPSGVYWLCCLEKQKLASGCTIGGHEEKRSTVRT